MTDPVSLTRSDLVPFADLGTEVREPQVSESGRRFTLTRNGVERTILVGPDQRVTLSYPVGQKQSFLSPAAMLAGSAFEDLDRWSQHQAYVFKKPECSVEPISMKGTLQTADNGGADQTDTDLDVEGLDRSLTEGRSGMATDISLILVVDGPAGSGKTTLIQELARRRAYIRLGNHRARPGAAIRIRISIASQTRNGNAALATSIRFVPLGATPSIT